MTEAWQQWHEYVFDSDTPLTVRERRLLAAAAADECCDGARADELAARTRAMTVSANWVSGLRSM